MTQLALRLRDPCSEQCYQRCAVPTWWRSLVDTRCPMAGCWTWLWWMPEGWRDRD